MTVTPFSPEEAGKLAPGLLDMQDAIDELQAPTKPSQLWVCASSALPRPASNWAGCVASLSDLPTLAMSNGTNWVRVDTGAVL